MTKADKNPIGVMQGRLLPKYQGCYQAHPLGYWQDEFRKASDIGLECIEFILDYNDVEKNPLLSSSGVDEILSLADSTRVTVKTVCADYFMEAPLHVENIERATQSLDVLKRLLASGEALGLTDIVIPCVDQSSLADLLEQRRFVERLLPAVDVAEKTGINLSLETDLAPGPFSSLLASFDSGRVTVNYDIGNSAAMGYDPMDEFSSYGSKISDIHIKDRIRGGGSVKLGQGDAKFGHFFKALKKIDYRGPFIMQAFRDDEGTAVFLEQLAWFKRCQLENQAS